MAETGESKHLPEYPFDLDFDARFAGVRAAMDYLLSENLRVTALQVDEAVSRFFDNYAAHIGRGPRPGDEVTPEWDDEFIRREEAAERADIGRDGHPL